MTNWEYLRLNVWIENEYSTEISEIRLNGKLVYQSDKKGTKLILSDYLTDIGKQGWEMVSVYQQEHRVKEIFHFKRPVDK